MKAADIQWVVGQPGLALMILEKSRWISRPDEKTPEFWFFA